MGQYSVILVISALFLGAVLLFNARASTGEATSETTAYTGDRFAREAAQVGLEEIERILADSIDYWILLEGESFSGTHGDAAYEVTITQTVVQPPPPPGTNVTISDKAWVTARCSLDVWNPDANAFEDTKYVIKAVYEKGYTDVGIPPTSRITVFSNSLVELRGTTYIDGNVHSNGELESVGNVQVTGSGTYTNGPDSSTPSQFASVSQADSITFPVYPIPPATITYSTAGFTLNASTHPLPTGRALDQAPGWFSVSGKGTEADPYILYVNGNLIIEQDVRIVGYSQIYVNGSVTIQGNASLLPVLAPAINMNNATTAQVQAWRTANLPDDVRIGLYANQEIDIKGTHLIAASLYSKTDIFFPASGKGALFGGAIAYNPLIVRGNARIFYEEASRSTIPGGFMEVPEGIRLIAYREWAERP